MVSIKEEDKRLLLRAIRRGEAFLVLGAGASATSDSKKQKPILQGKGFAERIAEMAGLKYSGEALTKVLSAALKDRISKAQLNALIQEEFLHCKPSKELCDLLRYTWWRLYTWNLDDTVENFRQSPQTLKIYNGMMDQVLPNRDPSFLQIVHLHGEAARVEQGYVLTERDYNDALIRGHPWYKQLAVDYTEKVPVFIGSQLNEPVLSLELERARPTDEPGLGRAFLVSPDEFTEIDIADLNARGISLINGYLSDFVDFLHAELGASSFSPKDVESERNDLGREIVKRVSVKSADLPSIQSIKVIVDGEGVLRIMRIDESKYKAVARQFLEGRPPNWEIINSDIPVELAQVRPLYERLIEAYNADARFLIAYGQSGSGKTTALMQSLLRFHAEYESIPIYEVGGDVPSLRDAVHFLVRLHPDEKIMVFIGETFVFGDSLAEDILSVAANKVLFVGDARTKEWKNHISRRLTGVNLRSFEFQRFEREDYPRLSAAILKYVPAPRFHKLSHKQRLDEFDRSKKQLLIALKEATHSRKFKEVIKEEFNSLSHEDVKLCFLIVGVSTLARSGISEGMAREAYEALSTSIPFKSATSELEGIVNSDRNGRLVARHESYVRYIIDNIADLSLLKGAVTEMLRVFVKYSVPVIKSVGRQDGILFRFLLNHDFMREAFRRRGEAGYPVDIYKEFEIPFQRDGHFWLQYGQYFSDLEDFESALSVLEKSIQAYPENDFAAHALADMQLRVAAQASSWSEYTIELVDSAVKSLKWLHKNRVDKTDHYPIVTLAERHVLALLKHGHKGDAVDAAKEYFRDIEAMQQSSAKLSETKRKLLVFLTRGVPPETNM
ncbi:SIR2 family protein [Chromohalobacter israelensis]|uniref:P-loop NTPase n=1 Tax=Chromohalobacter israelensis TaxID=141390 RepID=UPI003AF8348A